VNHERRAQAFPKTLERFGGLAGGTYGWLDVVARSRERVELQTGEDFVQLDRAQAEALRAAIDAFLGLSQSAEEVVVAVEREVVVLVEEPSGEGGTDEHRHGRAHGRKRAEPR